MLRHRFYTLLLTGFYTELLIFVLLLAQQLHIIYHPDNGAKCQFQTVSGFFIMVTCTHCGSIDNYRTELKSTNLCAYCNDCGFFIKNIPYSKPAFYIGKYKGQFIENIDDLAYLQWAHTNMSNISQTFRAAIKEQINRLEMLRK